MVIVQSTKAWSPEKVGEHDYHVFRLHVAAKGSFSQLVSFISQLEYGEFKTLIVERLSVTRDSQQSGESVSEVTIPVTASLNLAIYTPYLTSD